MKDLQNPAKFPNAEPQFPFNLFQLYTLLSAVQKEYMEVAEGKSNSAVVLK